MGTVHQGIARRYTYACELQQRGTDEDRRQAFITFDQVIDLAILRYLKEGRVAPNLLKKYGGDVTLKNDRRRRQDLLGDILHANESGVARADLRDLQQLRNRFYHDDVDIVPSSKMLSDARGHARAILKVLFGIDPDAATDETVLTSLAERPGTPIFSGRAIRTVWVAYSTLKYVAEYFDIPSTSTLTAQAFQEEWSVLSSLNDNRLSDLNPEIDLLIGLVQRTLSGSLPEPTASDAGLIRKAAARIRDTLGTLHCISMKARAQSVWGLPEELSQLLLRIEDDGVTLEAVYSDGRPCAWSETELGSDVLVNAPNALIDKIKAQFDISEPELYEQPEIQARFGLLYNRDCILARDRDEMIMAYADLWHRE